MPKHCSSTLTLIICGIIILTMPFVATGGEPAPVNAQPVAKAEPAPAPEQKAASPAIKADSLRIGYVDIMKIAEQSEAGKVAKAHFEAKADKFKAQIETKQKLLEKQKATLESKLPTYTLEQRTSKIKEYEKKVEELRKMLQKADKEMKPMQEELIRGIYEKIKTAATSYGESNGYTVILVKSDLLYLDKIANVQDVTEALIQQVNKNNQ